ETGREFAQHEGLLVGHVAGQGYTHSRALNPIPPQLAGEGDYREASASMMVGVLASLHMTRRQIKSDRYPTTTSHRLKAVRAVPLPSELGGYSKLTATLCILDILAIYPQKRFS